MEQLGPLKATDMYRKPRRFANSHYVEVEIGSTAFNLIQLFLFLEVSSNSLLTYTKLDIINFNYNTLLTSKFLVFTVNETIPLDNLNQSYIY